MTLWYISFIIVDGLFVFYSVKFMFITFAHKVKDGIYIHTYMHPFRFLSIYLSIQLSISLYEFSIYPSIFVCVTVSNLSKPFSMLDSRVTLKHTERERDRERERERQREREREGV